MQDVDKRGLVTAIIDKLTQELAVLVASAEETRKGATHEESKPENDKDTRGLEASYLARGQARRVEETEEAITRLRFLAPRDFGPDDAVDVGAIVDVEVDGERQRVFVVPVAGGTTIAFGGADVRLVTPASPVGAALLGKRAGEDFELRVQSKVREYEVVAVR